MRARLPAAVLAASVPALAQAQRLGGGSAPDVPWVRLAAALLFCLMLAALALLFLRQRGGKADLRALFSRFEVRPRAIDVVETRRLSQHADICLVRHGGREYLMLLLAAGGQILSDRPAAADGQGDGPCG
jgi:hypothetical protein